MGRILWVLMISLSGLCGAEAQAKSNSSDLVRVRLMSSPQAIQIQGLNLRFQNLKNPYRPVAIPQNSRVEVRLMKKEEKHLWAVRLNNQEAEQLFADEYLVIQGEDLRVGARSLPSRILLSEADGQQMDLVGVIPLEDYLVGVLASEMPLSWPMEALKAQAVAARSYALSVMRERKDKAFHLESSILDQVFRHTVVKDGSDPVHRAAQAVRETRGVTLMDSQKKVLKAYFHSDCGGHTTTPQNVWQSGVNSGVAVDQSCPTNPKAQWTLTLESEELGRRLKMSQIVDIQLIRKAGESRVMSVRVTALQNRTQTWTVNEFRRLLGFQELRSSLFEMKKLDQGFRFEGQGFGHGVGLCQWGSRHLGLKGYNYKQILQHYYPLARLSY
ncbi:MAG: SpoIID/LytB domain-containing protein [Bdellovibrio sp.]